MAYRWRRRSIPPFILKLNGGRGQPHNPAIVTLKDKAPGAQGIGGWVGPRAGLEVFDNTLVFFPVTKLSIVHIILAAQF
jgi:hypothetical protein